jgi:hypothetical protein
MTNQTQNKPYAPIGIDCYQLPNGRVAMMNEEVMADDMGRITQEIMLIQCAIGVKPDGIIGFMLIRLPHTNAENY